MHLQKLCEEAAAWVLTSDDPAPLFIWTGIFPACPLLNAERMQQFSLLKDKNMAQQLQSPLTVADVHLLKLKPHKVAAHRFW